MLGLTGSRGKGLGGVGRGGRRWRWRWHGKAWLVTTRDGRHEAGMVVMMMNCAHNRSGKESGSWIWAVSTVGDSCV